MSFADRVAEMPAEELLALFLDLVDRSGIHHEDLTGNGRVRIFWEDSGWGDVYICHDEIKRRLAVVDKMRS